MDTGDREEAPVRKKTTWIAQVIQDTV